jgi:hypothetical protein
MKLNHKLGALLAAAGSLAVAVPALAHPSSSDHPSGSDHPSASTHAQSHKCKPHNVAYVESGTLDSATASTLAQNSDGTWSGTLVVDVTRTNHAARADKGQTKTYTFTANKLRVKFDGGATGFTAGERVKLIGKLASVAKKCAALDPAPAPTFRMVVVHPAPTTSGS